MTKKKRGHPDVEEILARPWCYYCERDFDDLKILINHQKAKHFKCDKCGRRLNTAGGLNVHMNQVHKENLTAIENALPNRAGLDVEIFGMEGIPDEIVQQHHQRVLTSFHQAEAERRATTGNPAPGAQSNNAPKKPKFESPSDLKKRLAEHKAAKLAAEQNGGGSSGGSTPVGSQAQLVPGQQPVQGQSTHYPGYQQPYAPPPSSATFSAPSTYNQPQPQGFQPTAYGAPPAGYTQSPPPQQPPFGQTQQNFHQMYGQPPQASFQPAQYPPNPSFSPPPFQAQPQFPNQGYQSQVPQNGYSGQVGAPRAYNSASPASQLPQNRTHSPSQNGPQRTGSGSLVAAPGLPQRPAVSAPPVNAAQFQQMHQGQLPTQHNFNAPQAQHGSPREEYNPTAPQIGMPRGLSNEALDTSSLDDLINSASKQADENAGRGKPTTPNPAESKLGPTATGEEGAEDKAARKDKDGKEKPVKPTRMIYSDNEISPEEKMAALPKYAFTPTHTMIQV